MLVWPRLARWLICSAEVAARPPVQLPSSRSLPFRYASPECQDGPRCYRVDNLPGRFRGGGPEFDKQNVLVGGEFVVEAANVAT